MWMLSRDGGGAGVRAVRSDPFLVLLLVPAGLALQRTKIQWGKTGKNLSKSFHMWMDKMNSIHKMNYYSEMKNDKLRIHAATWINLGFILLSESIHTQNDTYYIIPLIWYSGKGKVSGCETMQVGGVIGHIGVSMRNFWDDGVVKWLHAGVKTQRLLYINLKTI